MNTDQQEHGGAARRSIVFKLSLVVVAVLIVASAVMNAVGFAVGRQIVRDQVHRRLRVAGAARHKIISAYVNQQHERIALVASRTRLRRVIEEYLNGERDLAAMQAATRPILIDAQESTEGFLDIWITGEGGQVMTATSDDCFAEDHASDASFLEGRTRSLLGEPELRDGHYVTLLAAPARGSGGQFLGVVTVRLNVDRLHAIISDDDGLGATGEILVATQQADHLRYLFPPRTTVASVENAAVMRQAIEGETSELPHEAMFGETRVLAYRRPIEYQPRDFQHWGLVAKIDASEAYEPVYEFARLLILSEIILLCLGVLGAHWLARRFVRPLVRLTDVVTKIGQQDLQARAPITSTDEVGALARAFNDMADQVEHSHATLEERVDQRTADLQNEIEEHKRTQAALVVAKEAAEQASQAKSEFLANMSHEIRTPMNGILGMGELLGHTTLNSEQQDYLRLIQQSANSLLHLLNDILDVSKIEAGKLELEQISFSLRDCIGKAGQTLAVRASEKELELVCRIVPELPDTLVGDPGRFRQVILNLAGNAIKFAAEGEVLIEVTTEASSDDEITLLVSVKDTGIGIPAEKQALIFDAFVQADTSTTRQFGGTGLGLTISSQLVALMNGRIWLESEFGAGATFYFTATFGVRHDEPGNAPVTLKSLEETPVLIVDDNNSNRRMLQEVLIAWGLAPSIAEDGPGALQELRHAAERGEPYQLAILDLTMPGMDGFELAERINQQSELAGLTKIMMSSAARIGDADRCRDVGIARYMAKPVLQSELLNVILDLAGEPVVEEILMNAPAPSVGMARLRILLAEDGIVNQRVAAGMLKRRGDEVVIVSNGRQAIEAIEGDSFDLVLMDVQMPEVDGIEATVAIRDREKQGRKRTPIIAMTAAAMTGDRERCLEAGMDAYLSKPIDAGELYRLLDRYSASKEGLDHGSVIEPPVGDLADESAAEQRHPASNRCEVGDDVLDLTAAAEQIAGGDEEIREVARLLLGECPRLLAAIKEALSDADAKRLRREAHTLKGAADVFGAKPVVAAALHVEQLAHARKLHEAREAVEHLKDELASFETALMAYLERET